MRRLRRLLVAVIGLVATMALSGCDVTGTIKVRADDRVELDLRAVIDADQSCEWQLGPGVRTDERRMRNTLQRLCLLQGTVDKEELRRWQVNIAHTGEHLEVVANPLGVVGPMEASWSTLGVTDLAILVEFPGDVLDSTGIDNGNTVRFTDVGQLGRPLGLRALALDHAGPPLGIVLPVVAFGLGLFAMGALWASVNRQALADRFSAIPAATLGRKPPGPDQAPTARYPTIPAPGSLLPDDLRSGNGPPGGDDRLIGQPDRADGATGWERPGTSSDRPVEEAGRRPSEHEKWAPRDGPD